MLQEGLVNRVLFANQGQTLEMANLTGLPLWITTAAKIFVVNLDFANQIYFIKPSPSLSFDQLRNLHTQVEKKTMGLALIVADHLNSKFRALFVKNNVPFIYKQQSVFAPALGVKLFDYKERQTAKQIWAKDSLAPFELKLIAGYLTDFISAEDYNLDELLLCMSQNQYVCSKTKLSNAIKQLIKMNFMTVFGKGPNRRFRFNAKDQVFENLMLCHTKLHTKTCEVDFELANKNFIYSGETALAHFSNLNVPKFKHVAITNKEFLNLKINDTSGDVVDQKVVFEFFKEPPSLFAIDSNLNPVEIYLAFKNHHDERIQMSLVEMLSIFQLGDKRHGA